MAASATSVFVPLAARSCQKKMELSTLIKLAVALYKMHKVALKPNRPAPLLTVIMASAAWSN